MKKRVLEHRTYVLYSCRFAPHAVLLPRNGAFLFYRPVCEEAGSQALGGAIMLLFFVVMGAEAGSVAALARAGWMAAFISVQLGFHILFLLSIGHVFSLPLQVCYLSWSPWTLACFSTTPRLALLCSNRLRCLCGNSNRDHPQLSASTSLASASRGLSTLTKGLPWYHLTQLFVTFISGAVSCR